MAKAAASLYAANRIAEHFKGIDLHAITTIEKIFPSTVRPDLETAIGEALRSADGDGASSRLFRGRPVRLIERPLDKLALDLFQPRIECARGGAGVVGRHRLRRREEL